MVQIFPLVLHLTDKGKVYEKGKKKEFSANLEHKSLSKIQYSALP